MWTAFEMPSLRWNSVQSGSPSNEVTERTDKPFESLRSISGKRPNKFTELTVAPSMRLNARGHRSPSLNCRTRFVSSLRFASHSGASGCTHHEDFRENHPALPWAARCQILRRWRTHTSARFASVANLLAERCSSQTQLGPGFDMLWSWAYPNRVY